MALRSGTAFGVTPEGASTFRYFVDRDADMWREMDSFLAMTRDRKRLLDVGAHYGVFSLAFTVSVGKSALAVEPCPEPRAVLAEHVRLNPAARIGIAGVALGARNSAVAMTVSGSHLEAAPDGTSGSVGVTAVTADALIADLGFRPDTVKVDAEGYELSVLEGMRGLLTQSDVILFLEVHPAMMRRLGRSPGELIDLLHGLGYRILDGFGQPIADPAAHLDSEIRRVVCRKPAAR